MCISSGNTEILRKTSSCSYRPAVSSVQCPAVLGVQYMDPEGSINDP
jgi:hypothetical protein